jgi:hypothetical protein
MKLKEPLAWSNSTLLKGDVSEAVHSPLSSSSTLRRRPPAW